MTAKKQLPRSFSLVCAVISIMLIAYGCGGGSSAGPSPIPTPTPGPTLLQASTFQIVEGQLGFAAISPFTVPVGGNTKDAKAGTFRFVATWNPAPPTGQMYLGLIRDPSDQSSCYLSFSCSQLLAKDTSGTSPKEVKLHLEATERVYFWARPVTGTLSVTVEIWFTPDK